MKLGIVTYNIAKDWDVPTLIKMCETVGLEAVELRTTHAHKVEPTLSARERAAVRKQFEASKVRLLSLGSVCEFHSPDPDEVRRNIEECHKFVDLAYDLGAAGVKVRPNNLPDEVAPEKTIRQIGESLRTCGEYAAPKRIGIWVEVHGRKTCDPRLIRQMIDIADHPSVGVCWNSNETDLIDGSIKPAFYLLAAHIRNVHINDLWSPYPYRQLFALLKEIGYEGYCLAEIQASAEPERLLRHYRALWIEMCR